jgi:cardiolipin synthase
MTLKTPNLSRAITNVSGSAEWTEEIVFNTGDAFFENLIQSIALAKTSIHLETYIFDLDVLGLQILNLLSEAGERGVQVRLMLDGVGASNWNLATADHWRRKKVNVRFFHPLAWQKSFKRFWQSLTFRKIALGFSKVNHRNHRKICIIDHQIAFVGSMNISARHLNRVSGTHTWRDTAVRIQGDGVDLLVDACNEAWDFSKNYYRRRRIRRTVEKIFQKIRINCSEAQREVYYQNLVKHLEGTTQRIWITNAYFVPDHAIVTALEVAAERGIDVRLLFPYKSDFFGVKLAMESFYTPLMQAGVQIYEYTPAMLHAKVMILDNWVTVGSSNLDHRSLFQDLEADVILTKAENITLLGEQFLKDLTVSKQVQLVWWKNRSLLHRLLEKLFMRFRAVL